MDAAGGDEEHVARRDLVVGQDLRYGPVPDAALILLRSNRLGEAGVQVRPFGRTYHVPHLALALAAVPCEGQRIVRMHLYAQVPVRVNELYQQRELPAVHLAEAPAGLGSFGHNRFGPGHSGQHPALSPPHQGLQYRFELVH